MPKYGIPQIFSVKNLQACCFWLIVGICAVYLIASAPLFGTLVVFGIAAIGYHEGKTARE